MSTKVNPFRVIAPLPSGTSGPGAARPAETTGAKSAYQVVHEKTAHRGGSAAPTGRQVVENGRRVEDALAGFEKELDANLPPRVADALHRGADQVEAFARQRFGENPGPKKG